MADEEFAENIIDLVERISERQYQVEQLRSMDQDGFRRMAESTGMLPDMRDLRRMLNRKLHSLQQEERELTERIQTYRAMGDAGLIPIRLELDAQLNGALDGSRMGELQEELAHERVELIRLRRWVLEKELGIVPKAVRAQRKKAAPRKGRQR